jgi:ribose transport system substrate-binding protein
MLKFMCVMWWWVLLALPVHAADAKKLIAFAQDDLANDFRRAQVQEVRDAVASHAELAFVHSDAQGQTSLLIRHIERFIEQKVDLLIVGTNDAEAVVPAVRKAYRQHIPGIILDRGIKGTDYTTFINSDNIRIGRLGAEYIARHLNGKGTALLLEGLPAADVTALRSRGFLNEMARHPGIKVIRRTGNYLRRDAVLEMEKLLAQGQQVDAIFSESDSMLSGVRVVLSRHDIKPESIIMVGCDYTSEAQAAIRDGSQSASILFPLGGRQAVEVARKIFAGERFQKHIVIPVELVSRENVERVKPIF